MKTIMTVDAQQEAAIVEWKIVDGDMQGFTLAWLT